MSTAAAVKRLTHRPDAPALYLIPMVSGDTSEATRAEVDEIIATLATLQAEAVQVGSDGDVEIGERHLRHWQGILAAIDAFEGVAA